MGAWAWRQCSLWAALGIPLLSMGEFPHVLHVLRDAAAAGFSQSGRTLTCPQRPCAHTRMVGLGCSSCASRACVLIMMLMSRCSVALLIQIVVVPVHSFAETCLDLVVLVCIGSPLGAAWLCVIINFPRCRSARWLIVQHLAVRGRCSFGACEWEWRRLPGCTGCWSVLMHAAFRSKICFYKPSISMFVRLSASREKEMREQLGTRTPNWERQRNWSVWVLYV